jgi:orotidine-5'-phosphate decarboxylase
MDRTGGAVCVGLDPVLDRLPSAIGASDPVDRIRSFSLGVVDAVSEIAACLKVQSACYERYGAAGVGVVSDIIRAAGERDLPVILDAKRGDIGITARHYAAAAFGGAGHGADWLTVNGYLGGETVEPYLERGGVFVLVRTSNSGSGELQQLALADGRTVSEAMADIVAALAAPRIGPGGWSDVGAVVGATHPAEAASLRARMPGVICLVPGIGAQGGRMEDVADLCGPDGHGALFTASRSIIYADPKSGHDWLVAIRDAASALSDASGVVAGLQ